MIPPVNKNREIVRNFMANLQSYLMLAKNSGCDDEAIKNLNELILNIIKKLIMRSLMKLIHIAILLLKI